MKRNVDEKEIALDLKNTTNVSATQVLPVKGMLTDIIQAWDSDMNNENGLISSMKITSKLIKIDDLDVYSLDVIISAFSKERKDALSLVKFYF